MLTALKLKKLSLIIFISSLLLFGLYLQIKKFSNKNLQYTSNLKQVVLYKDPNCSCCEGYVAYLRKNNYKVKVITTSNISGIKSEKQVPWSLQSCHTAVFSGKYIIEGHVPLQAIETFISESPKDVLGIALPGMPLGSPGMGGVKSSFFKIYQFKNSKDYSLYAEL